MLFDYGFLTSKNIAGKSICVGNISAGGSGKSPHVAYLISLLWKSHQIQVLSRGYGRKSKGYILLDDASNPSQVGDEPHMLYKSFSKKAQFAVCEKRLIGVQKLRSKSPDSLILLDDAFQHRWVRAGLQLVLTSYQNPFWKDTILPSGRLRESISGLKRADALIITKCPDFDSFEPNKILSRLSWLQKPIFFSRYEYHPLKPLTRAVNEIKTILLVSAIAEPQHLKESLVQSYKVEEKIFKDHHAYSKRDIQEIHHFFDNFADEQTILVTTSKDWTKINLLLSEKDKQRYPWYLLSFDLEWYDQEAFNNFIGAYVKSD